SLNLAAGAGASHVIKFLLLQECTNIDRLDANGFSPLHLAALGHHLEVVRLLLSHGADLGSLNNHPKFNDSTTLKLLTEQDQDEIIELLVRYNTERYKKHASYLRPALWSAIDSERLHILRILIHGQDFEYPEARGMLKLGLMRCTKTGFVDGVSVFLEMGVPGKACVDGQAVLEVASGAGNEPIVKLLLAAGADVNAEPARDNGRTALQAASGSGNEPIVKLLLAAGADVNAEPASDNGRTALQAASGSGNEPIVKLLLAAGADVNAAPVFFTGRTALQAASGSGNEPIVKLLLAAGADVNAAPASWDGRTALQEASGSGNEPIVKLLLAAGAC
ncbi:ankyrin repeat-containing domain protein, partial [Morchella snyderi]